MANFASKRSVFDLTHERKLSCDMGKLVPIMCEEVVPGDSFKAKTEMLVRLSPLLAPVYHRINAFTHYFFVPTRLLQTNWESFITGGVDGTDATAIPTIAAGAGGQAAGTLWDYFGLPTGVNISVVAYPFRAYQMIYRDWYRDQTLQTAPAIGLGDGVDATTSLTLQTRCWEKDYFTSALPWAQRGASVTLPLGTSAPVLGIGKEDQTFLNGPRVVYESDGTTSTYGKYQQIADTGATNRWYVEGNAAGTYPNVRADLSNATAATVNSVRQAFQLQRWFEKNARGGARYIESVMAHFNGVRPEDYRVQRPEYLGGGRSPIVVSEVIQTAPTVAGQTPIGTMAGHAFSAQASHEFSKSFTEHGYIIGILSIMPRTAYYQGAPRMWNRTSRLDFYWPEFAHLGEQGILQKEIYADGTANDNGIFGYAPRYEEYRQRESSFHGDFRGTLDYWHMGRKFAAAPALNSAFVTADPTKRIHAVTNAHTCWIQVLNQVTAIRPIPRSGVPGMIDHG